MAIKDALLADYDHEMGTTRRLLERVPDDKLAWRPHDKSRSMGDLATHVSRIPSWGGIILNGQSFDLSDAPPEEAALPSRGAILASFNETSARTRANSVITPSASENSNSMTVPIGVGASVTMNMPVLLMFIDWVSTKSSTLS